MKITRLITIAAFSVLVASACAVSSSSIPNLSQVRNDVRSAAGTGQVTILLRGSTATLVGQVKSITDANAAVRVAQNAEGIDRVLNRITISN